MTSGFEARKQKILEQLNAPNSEYHDLSPKGSVDKPIQDLIGEINGLDGIVTTSSCSGRITVYLEGNKVENGSAMSTVGSKDTRARPGGKGGGAWLFVSHTPLKPSDDATGNPDYMSVFGLDKGALQGDILPNLSCRFIHLKFEPMILHISSASLEHAQRILTVALSAGFRESGAVSLGSTKLGEISPMVAVRSTGYSFDSIIGYHDERGRNVPLVNENYLQTLIRIANERFKINTERIARFRTALKDLHQRQDPAMKGMSKSDWEDAEVRKRRKREEGLARREMLQAQSVSHADTVHQEVEIDTIKDIFRESGMTPEAWYDWKAKIPTWYTALKAGRATNLMDVSDETRFPRYIRTS